ncbi:UNVERIFIED_CONTAM: Transmembrane protein 50B, partial [Eudyptes robustus]
FNFNLDSLREIEWETRRNHLASVASGFLFFLGLWIYVDTAVVYGKEDWTNAYIVVTIASVVGMFMVNAVSNRTVQGISYDEGILGTRGARLWLMIAFVLSFASLVAGLWLMFSDYVLRKGDHPNWPGVALFLNNFLIFCASLVYKFGRLEELWQ